MYKSLVINPGSTTTEIAVFAGENSRWQQAIEHSRDEIDSFDSVIGQLEFRQNLILEELEKAGYEPEDFDFIVARGGLLAPISGGTYEIDEEMVRDLKSCEYGEHASNLAGIIAHRLAENANIRAFTVDPVAVDEFEPEARLSGLPELPRRCQSHALNLKGMARKCAKKIDKELESTGLIGAHLGGGISVAPLDKGRIIDVNNANQGGPFSPERTGTLPALDLVEYIFDSEIEKSELKKKMVGRGGLTAYLGSADAREVEKRIEAGDEEAESIFRAMIYQISREIGRMSAVLGGDVDAVFLTGGLAHSDYLTSRIESRVEFIAPVHIFPGSEELENLARGGLRVMRDEEQAKKYSENQINRI